MVHEHSRISRRITYGLSTLLLWSAASGCDPAGGSSSFHFDGFPPLTSTREIRIGDVDDPDVGFSQILRVDMDRDGNVYVLEGAVPEIRVYSPDGRILRRIGRRGGGPGEFEGGPRFGVVGDTLWAFDSRNMRITLFRRDGTLLSTGRTEGLRIELPLAYGTLLPWIMRPDGRFISHFGRVSGLGNDPPTGIQPTDSIPVPFVLFDANGEVTDTAGWAPRPPPRMWRPPEQYDIEFERIEIAGRRLTVPRPPTTMPWWEPQADGYVLVETPIADNADEGALTVTRFGVTGDTVFSRSLRYRPEPYTDAALDSIAARAARGGPGGMVPYSPGQPPPENWRAIARVLRDEMRFPAFQIPVQYPWVAQDGSVWLRRWDETAPDAEWFILDPEGNPKGRLELSSGIRVLWNVGEVFWAVENDDVDVPWLVRYRIGSG